MVLFIILIIITFISGDRKYLKLVYFNGAFCTLDFFYDLLINGVYILVDGKYPFVGIVYKDLEDVIQRYAKIVSGIQRGLF